MSLFQKSVENKYLSELDSVLIDQKYKQFQDYFGNPEIQENIRNSKEEQFQEGFLRELFVKIFGYTLNPQPNFNLTTELKNISNSRKADGAILRNGNALAVIELKGTDTADLDTIETQAFGYKNHHPKCVYVITSNFEKLRFYIQNAVEHLDFDLFNLSREKFSLIWLCLASENLLNDLPLKIKESSVVKEESITKELYTDYSTFRKALYTNLVQNNPDKDKLLLFKKTQKLLDRFLFIFFAEDRLLLPPNSISEIVKQWKTLKEELDEYIPLYDRYKKYFGYLNTGFKGKKYDIYAYNGGLFAPDEILDTISIDDDILHEHTLKLSSYDFETDVDVNILGHIFEHSLGEIESVQAEIKGETVDNQTTKRKKDGIFYTPKYITKYIVENTIGKLCEEKRSELNILDEEYAKGRRNRKKDTIKTLDDKLTEYRNWLLSLTILDPACGSGAFLNQALDFLITEHQKIDNLKAQLFGAGLIFSDITTDILEKNIYGVDLNEESVEIAKLSLWLRTAQKGRKLNKLNNNIKCGNSLIDDPEVAGEKAFNWQKEFPEIFTKGGFDVVIGNPPYAGRTSFISDIEKKFIRDNYKTSEGRFELYQLFIERSIVFTKNENGYISLITPQTWLSIIQATKLRKEVLKNNELFEIIFLGKDVFPDASVDTVVFIISKGKKNNYINYLNSSNLINTDLQNTEIQYSEINTSDFIIPSTSNNEYSCIEKKIKSGSVSLEEIGEWSDGIIVAGKAKEFAFSYEKTDESFFPMLIGRDVERYSTHWSGKYCCRDKNLIEQHNPSAYRLREERMFKRRKILIRKTGNSIVSTIDDSEYYYEQSLFSFGINDQSEFKLEFIQSILNSNLANFLLKMNSFSMKDTFPQIRIHWLKDFPIKKTSVKNQQLFIDKTHFMLQQSKELLDKSNSFTSLLKSKYSLEKISNKLQNWHELNFGDFLNELKKHKLKFSLNEEAEWMQYYNEQKEKAQALKIEITKTDREIDQMVYELYELTDEEIKVVEESI